MAADDLPADLVRSPLHDRHAALGAKFGEFGGWAMPLEYPTGVLKEHTGVRAAVGIFDVSHLGKLWVAGPGATAFIDATLSNDLGRIEPGRAQYTLCCDADTGGIVDDLIAYLHPGDRLLLMPNAANNADVVGRLRAEVPDGVTITDEHREYAVLAVQGPRSADVLEAVGLPTGHDFMSFAETGDGVMVCRSGYTGEKGYELVVPAAAAPGLWDGLLAAGEEHGMLPCGLGARDTLRTEMGYPLHGQDLSLDVTPNQARLGWAVGWQKQRFWGREVLLAERQAGPVRRLRGLRAAGRGIPRPGMAVLAGDEEVGTVTSGTFSPTLRTGIGLALLPVDVADGTELSVDIRGRHQPFVVTRPPFVDTSTRD